MGGCLLESHLICTIISLLSNSIGTTYCLVAVAAPIIVNKQFITGENQECLQEADYFVFGLYYYYIVTSSSSSNRDCIDFRPICCFVIQILHLIQRNGENRL